MLELESERGYLLRFPAGLSPELLARYVEALGPRDEIIARYTLPPPLPSPRSGCIVSISDKRRSA